MARAQSCGTNSGAKKRSRSEDNVAAVRNLDDDTRKILRDCQEYLLGASFKTPGSEAVVSVVSEGSSPGARGKNRPSTPAPAARSLGSDSGAAAACHSRLPINYNWTDPS